MSKYYKAEDVINRLADQWHFGAAMEYPDTAGDIEDWRKAAREFFADLPTIDIVHCGKCKCCRDELIEEYMPLYIYCEKWNHETGFDDFCSAGERIDK